MTDVVFFRGASDGGAYVRCELPARVLEARVVQLTNDDLKTSEGGAVSMRLPSPLPEVAVFQFPGTTGHALIIAKLQEMGVRVLIDVDDDYLNGHPTHGSRWIKGLPTSDDYASYEVHRRIASFCDGVICSTPELAARYHELNRTWVIPNTVDPGDWPYKPDAYKDPDEITVGWAGSPSHFEDLHLIQKALRRATEDRARVVLAGYDPKWHRQEYERVRWTDSLADYRRLLCSFDIGLAPLQRGPWEDCKSDLKALEYAMAGAAPVLSWVPAYDGWHHRGAQLKFSVDDFVYAVRSLIRNQDVRRRNASRARHYVLRERGPELLAERWEKLLASIRPAVGV